MPASAADSPDPSCSLLFSKTGNQESQSLGIDPFPARARAASPRAALATQRAAPAASAIPAACARPCGAAAEPAGAVKAARPQALSVKAARRAAAAAAARAHRPGGASRNRPFRDTHSRGSPAATIACGKITPAEGARLARRARTRWRAVRRLARFERRLAHSSAPLQAIARS